MSGKPVGGAARAGPGRSRRLLALALGVLTVVAAPAADAAKELHVIGTGRVVGLYYPVGGAVSLIVNDAEEDLLLTVKVTPGSVSNLDGLASGELSLALIQSDVAYQAYRGEGPFAGAPRENLRTLMGLHPEPLHLLCRRDAGVARPADLAGLRIAVGETGSGALETVRVVLDAYGLDETTDLDARYLPSDELPMRLARSEIDCFFFTVGIGGAVIHAAAALTDAVLVPLDDPALASLIDRAPYYAFVSVPGGTYRGTPDTVVSFGVRALLVSVETLPEDRAYRITRALLASFDDLRATYPAALEPLLRDEVMRGLGVPLHPGAERAYRESSMRLAR